LDTIFRFTTANIHSEVLAKRVYELKETQEGVEIMCREMDQIYKEGAKFGKAEGIEIGEMKKARETAYELHDMGMSVDKIAKAVKVSMETVQKWFTDRAALAK